MKSYKYTVGRETDFLFFIHKLGNKYGSKAIMEHVLKTYDRMINSLFSNISGTAAVFNEPGERCLSYQAVVPAYLISH